MKYLLYDEANCELQKYNSKEEMIQGIRDNGGFNQEFVDDGYIDYSYYFEVDDPVLEEFGYGELDDRDVVEELKNFGYEGITMTQLAFQYIREGK